MDRYYCDNCNAECRPRTVIVSWSEWMDGALPQREIHGLCEDCARAFAELDFEYFVVAHRDRPRSVTLP